MPAKTQRIGHGIFRCDLAADVRYNIQIAFFIRNFIIIVGGAN